MARRRRPKPRNFRKLLKRIQSRGHNKISNLTHDEKITIYSLVIPYCNSKSKYRLGVSCVDLSQLTRRMRVKSLTIYRPGHFLRHHTSEKHTAWKIDKELTAIKEDMSQLNHIVESIYLGEFSGVAMEKDIFATFANLLTVHLSHFEVSEFVILHSLKHLGNLKNLELEKAIVVGNRGCESEHSPVKLPDSLTKLSLSNVSLKNSPVSFIITLTQHQKIKHLTTSSLSDTQLINPYLEKGSPITHLDFSINNQIDSYSTLKNFSESNRNLYHLHIRFSQLTQNTVDIIANHFQHLKFLTLSNFSDVTKVYDRCEETNPIIDLRTSISLTKLKLDFNGLSGEAVNNLLVNMPQLTDLYISINNIIDTVANSIIHNCPLLSSLAIKYPERFASRNYDKKAMKYLFNIQYTKGAYSCANNLEILTIINLNILALEPYSINQFKKLELLNFYRNQYTIYNDQRNRLVEEHIKKFVDFRYFIEKSHDSRSGYLYKPRTTLKPLQWNGYPIN